MKQHKYSSPTSWFLGLLLVVATIVAYLPALRGGFIWDDDAYVTENSMLTAPEGLKQIWFSAHRQSQYFPLVYTTLRVERALWGLNPMGYHAVNILFHAANVLLVWLLLRRLAIPGAWLAAAIFALHPVHVESVAWITELKNTQSTLFYLLTLLAWLKFSDKETVHRWRFYALTLLLFTLALFSKTTACTLPAALLLVLWWRHEPIGWKRMAQIVPFLGMGLAMGALSVWWEKHLGNYNAADIGMQFDLLERLLIASRAVWFYAAKLFWPINLSFSYPRWEINPHAPLQYAGLLAIIVTALVLWRWRPVFRGTTACLIFFVTALSPLLGFIPLYTFRYSFVADHYQYVASLGLIVLFAGAVSNWALRLRLDRVVQTGATFFLLLTLGVLTWRQCGTYADRETLWRATIARNPESWLAHYNLVNVLITQGKLDEAVQHCEAALKIKPDHTTHNSLGVAFAAEGKLDKAIQHFEQAIQLRPHFAEAHINLANALTRQGRPKEAIEHYECAIELKPDNAEAHNNLAIALAADGKLTEAVQHYQRAVQLKPDYVDAHINLANALDTQGKSNEAVQQYYRALRLKPDSPEAHYNLAGALATQGKLAEAIQHFQQALNLATAQGKSALAEAVIKSLQSCQAALQEPKQP